MTMSWPRIGLVAALASALFVGGVSAAAEDARHQVGHAEHAEHDFHRHHISVFVGNTRDEDSFEADTIGAEYEYRLDKLAGIGVLAERAGGDVDTWVLGIPLILHPWRGLRLVSMPGTELEDSHRKLLIRVGIGYQFFIDDWSLEPMVNWDAIHGDIKTVVGLNVGRGF